MSFDGKRDRRKWCSSKEYRELFAAVMARDGMICCWCGCPVFRKPLGKHERVPDDAATLDHLVKRAHGGANSVDNLAMACNRCNFDRDYRSGTAGPITEAQLIALMT